MLSAPTVALPELGGSKVVNILMVVVLPAPLEPRRAKISPAFTEILNELTATNEPKHRVRFFVSRTDELERFVADLLLRRYKINSISHQGVQQSPGAACLRRVLVATAP